ncbi:hypothetical protein PQR66_09485 [Paraburkholderia agricolaris]|uniref:Uncharacterized protein n=1 Tax=Paraburkholderia agricolaris TaxID=2152888 RepID=A0ABW8ZJW2_9BURK|nr:hypothetical protein [Paraburkholderia agricolaris]
MSAMFRSRFFTFDIFRRSTILRGLTIALVGGGFLILSGCAADGHLITVQEVIANSRWTGRPINEALAKWGKPTGGVRHAEDGTTVYIWNFGQNSTYGLLTGTNTQLMAGGAPGGTLVTTNEYEQHTDTLECLMLINADSKGIITHFETKENFLQGGCKGFYHSAKAP